MKSRDVARAAKQILGYEARRTRATTRGNVQSVNADGTAQVIFSNGGVHKVSPRFGQTFSEKTSVALVRTGNGWEVLDLSAYAGGLGSPFDAS